MFRLLMRKDLVKRINCLEPESVYLIECLLKKSIQRDQMMNRIKTTKKITMLEYKIDIYRKYLMPIGKHKLFKHVDNFIIFK
jgi:hypothetical protein